MKKISFYTILILFSVLIFSCGNSGKNNSNNENKDSVDNKTVEAQNEKDSKVEKSITKEYIKDKVEFQGVYLSTAGAIYSFETENGDKLDIYDKTKIPQEMKNAFSDATPNQQEERFENVWYDVEYEFVDVEFYDGSTGGTYKQNVPQIVSFSNSDGNSNNSNNSSNVFNLNDIKKGDKIFGLTVESVDYEKGQYFSVQYAGEFTVKGNLQYNDFEGSYDIFLDEKNYPDAKIKAEGNEYVLFTSLSVYDVNQIKNLSEMHKSELQTGAMLQDLTFTCKGLRAGDYLAGDKGVRIGNGLVLDYIKINL